jgi:S-adenosylmethionine-dependent methyltransferase
VTKDPWADLADPFVDGHYNTRRGKVRTHVIHHHLRTHLPPPPARLIDVGGGAGHQSLPLARDGYDITLVDPSSTMLERARQQLAQEPADVAQRIHLVEARAEDAPEILGERFAGVLCHGVIMYIDEPQPFVAALAALAQPGALVSLVAKNQRVMAVLPAIQSDWAGVLAGFDATTQINGLGVATRGDTLEDVTSWFNESGIDLLAWYGVRLFTDGWISPRDGETTDDLMAAEVEASRRDPYRQMSRLFHVLGTRR